MNLEKKGPVNLDKKKSHYFSKFALKQMEEMRILRKGGVLGKENEDWRNVSEHCLAEAVAGDILAEALGADRDTVIKAALLHDWYKRREVEAQKRTGHGGAGYWETATEDERLLSEYGIPEELIAIAHSNIPKSADPHDWQSHSLEENIVYFMDLITSGTELVDVEERLRRVGEKRHAIEFSESFREIYGGKSLLELQREVGPLVQDEFERRLSLEPNTLIAFIKSKLSERISSE